MGGCRSQQWFYICPALGLSDTAEGASEIPDRLIKAQ